MPILSGATVTEENRFGFSLQQIKTFRYKLLSLKRNGQPVRARWEVEWQTTEQSNHTNKFLYEILANKEIIRHVSTRTEIRPIPAQWTHLIDKLKKAKAFNSIIDRAYGKLRQESLH